MMPHPDNSKHTQIHTPTLTFPVDYIYVCFNLLSTLASICYCKILKGICHHIKVCHQLLSFINVTGNNVTVSSNLLSLCLCCFSSFVILDTLLSSVRYVVLAGVRGHLQGGLEPAGEPQASDPAA